MHERKKMDKLVYCKHREFGLTKKRENILFNIQRLKNELQKTDRELSFFKKYIKKLEREEK